MDVHIEKKSLYYNLQCILLIAKGFWFLSASWFRKLCTQQYIFQLQDTVLKIGNCTSVSHHLLIFPHYVRMLTMLKCLKFFGFQLTYHTRDLAAFCYLVKARWILRRTALTSPWKHLFCVSATESSTWFTISLNSSSRLYFIVREVSKYWQLWISATRIASERKT